MRTPEVPDEDDRPRPVGVVPIDGRASMPFALLHGESLVAVAAWALGEAGVDLLDFDADWRDVQARETALVVHDPLCPATPVAFLAEAIAAAGEDVLVGIAPGSPEAVASPVVLPAAVVAALDAWPDLDDLGALVEGLRGRFTVRHLEAPPAGRRVADEADVRLLESDAPGASDASDEQPSEL